MNSLLLALALLCVFAVDKVCCFSASAGASSLVGSITGGQSDVTPDPTRWIEFLDPDNDWSLLGMTFTVEAWIMNSGSGASFQPVLVRHPGLNAPREEAHFIIGINNNTTMSITAGCGCNSQGMNCGNGFYLSHNFSSGVWHHVAVTFDGDTTGSSEAIFYLDGTNVAHSFWGQNDTQCKSGSAQWSEYAPVNVGFLDDNATTPTSEANPNDYLGWTGMIDEIRFWTDVQDATDIQEWANIGLLGHEEELFAYYQFSPLESELVNVTMPIQISNKVGDYLNGTVLPDPMDVGIFAQFSNLQIYSYSMVQGQSNLTNLPRIPNPILFESWPMSNTTTYKITGYSPALSSLLANNETNSSIVVSSNGEVTLYLVCPNNNCSNYTSNWLSYYINYTANVNGVTTNVSKQYLEIEAACPSGVFDECGECEGNNTLCQCVVYHGFEDERMSYVLLEWSIQNILMDLSEVLGVLNSTIVLLQPQTTLTTSMTPAARQEIDNLMTFYNTELTPYCGDVQDFIEQLMALSPSETSSDTLVQTNTKTPFGAIPYVPGFIVTF